MAKSLMLSRCRSLQGISLEVPLFFENINVCCDVKTVLKELELYKADEYIEGLFKTINHKAFNFVNKVTQGLSGGVHL